MPTEREVQGEIRQLRTELGIQTESEVQAEISTLQHELSLLPETFEEFTVRRQEEEERPISEDVSAFASGLGEGVGMLWDQAGNFASELINNGLPVFTAGKVVKDTAVVGAQDFGRFAKTITQAAFDKTYSEEEEIQREYKRYIQNHDYNTKVRPAMLGQVENRAITEFAANFVDPTLVLPVAGWGAKAGSVAAKGLQKAASAGAIATRSKGLIKTAEAAERVAGGLGAAAKDINRVGYVMALPSKAAAITLRKGLKGAALGGALAAKGVALAGETTAKIAGTPRKLIAAAAAKVVPTDMKSLAGASAFGGQLVGAMTGAVPGAAQLGIAEAAGFVAGKLGRSAESVLTTLSQKGGNGRFLYRLATSEAAALPVRRAAMWAYTHAGTRLGDSAFNMAVNGASVGALNAALAWAADEPAEGMGAAAGAGALMGGVMPFGQPGLKGGKSQGARDATSIQNHIRNKVVADQRASFLKIPKDSQLMIATLNEANVGSPKVVVLPKDVYLDAFPDTSANYSIEERKIYVNEGRLKRGSQQAVELMAHEVGHDFVHQSLGNDPAMLRMLLEPYETTIDKGEAFYFQFDKGSGNPIGEPIYLDGTASAIRTDYDRRFPTGEAWKGIGKNASTLAQEIGADQFSMMFSENPNAFDNFHPRLRRHLIDGSRKFLAATGQAEPLTGNPLTNTVSKQLHRNPAIARLYRNYGKARSFELIEKGNQAEAGVLIEPRKGQTGEDRFQELFGGVGISLKEGKNLRVTDKALFRELERIKERYRDDAPQGWKVTKQGWLTGKVLPDELRTIFTRNDRFGNVANILDALQESLSQRFGVRFGYRSGTKSKYQNPFKIRDAGLYAWMVSPIKFSGSASSQRPTRPTLKVVGFDEAKVRHNIQVLVEKGYVPDPVKFMADFAAQAQKALDDPEGRINPEGRKENERFTVAFGLKESADQIASPGLKELLESKTVKKTFVSYDVEALAGLAKGRDSAFAFDYENIRDNYSPFFSTRNFMPRRKPGPDDTIPLPFPELPGDIPGEGFGRMINVDKSKSEIAKAKAMADEQDGFSSSGTVRAKNADGRDKLFMPAKELRKELGVEQAKEIEHQRLFMPTPKAGEDYRGFHKAPGKDYGAPLHDVTGMYPEDIYSPQGARYYGSNDRAMDAKSIAIIHRMRGNPEGEVTIFRAVPEYANDIRPGDWVSLIREYAELHGKSGNAGGDGYKILSKKVKASEVFTEANSLHEWGWSPETTSGDKLFMPAATPESVSPNTVREGDVVRLNEESLRLFMPANDKVRLEDYADRKMFALASDRLGIGRMLTGPKGKKKELTIDAQGGRGFMQIFNGGGWAFKGKQTADNFIKRVKDVAGGEDSVIVGITILSDLNHLHSAYGQLAYTNALRAAIESGTITEGMANRQIREIVKRIKQAKTKKPLPAESRKVVEAIKNFADFEKAVKAKKINFNLMAKVREKAEGKTLPLTATEAAKLELDVPSIARDIADPELVGADFGKVVALLEVPVNQTPKKTDFHYSYPYTIEGHKIGFLEEFADVGELTSDPKVRTKQGRITAQPLQTVMPEFDKLRGNRFMPAK